MRIRIPFVLILLFICCSAKPVTEVTPAGGDKEVVCFIYHRFGDSRYPTTNTTVKDFEEHLAYLSKHNFQVLSFSDAIRYLGSGEPHRKTAVITIDDGYKSFYKHGWPLLKKYRFAATLFINTKTVGGGDYMNWKELEEVKNGGLEIGNHTHSHDFFLNKEESSRYNTFREEIELSQSMITDHLDVTPTVFSYPYGEFDPRMKDIVKAAGFLAAAAQNSGVIHASTDLFNCPRFPMAEAYSSAAKFTEKVSMHALKILKESPPDFIMPAGKKPLLELTIDNTGLNLKQLQCFVQGGECTLRVVENIGNSTRITIQSAKPITGRRRTLYTITVPDGNGAWHWYSHLWIDSGVH